MSSLVDGSNARTSGCHGNPRRPGLHPGTARDLFQAGPMRLLNVLFLCPRGPLTPPGKPRGLLEVNDVG